ncbi:uncharacterized protein V6R79_008242 [Siganus canaliculatus]
MEKKAELHTSGHASGHASLPGEELSKPVSRRSRCRAAATLSRRSQRGKRRGPSDKRRGQEDKRRGQEDKKEGVTVKRTWSDGKRRWDKKHYCVFCRRPQVKIARHLLRKHADQQEVAAASSLPAGSKQRHLLLEHLRCRGNYLHNIEVIRQGSGEIVPWRQPSEEVDARNYLPCPLCLGFFLRADLWKHQASCRRKMSSRPAEDSPAEVTSDPVTDCADVRTSGSLEDAASELPGDHVGNKRPTTSDSDVDQNVAPDLKADEPRKRTRVQAAASRLLPISSGASESCSEVLHRMNQDHVSHQVKADWLICRYGNKLMGNQDSSPRKYDYVSQRLRKLGKLLLAAKSLDSSVKTLQDLLVPGRLSLALTAARKASGYRWSRPPLAVKTTLKTVCEICIEESLQDGDWEVAAKTTDFYHLLGRDWDNLGLLDPDPDTAGPVGGAKVKKRSVLSRTEKEHKEPDQGPFKPRPEGPSQTSHRPLTSMFPPVSKLQTPLTVPVAPRKIQRRPWSPAEKEAVWRQLGVHVLAQSVPGKEVCQRCLDLEPVLRGRHWKDIKNQIHNQIQSQKKQQFHAQMDLQENQEHQDQIQSQKQQQQYQAHPVHQNKDDTHNQKKNQYQAQVDQQDQDTLQSKKKQQYHVQMDPQDHSHIHNSKKQPYQLDPQDHLQVHKKQLCHSRLVHEDLGPIPKKQVYQMEQQPQGLQPTLDRSDTSVLTGTLFGTNGVHSQSLLERDSITPYPLQHRPLGPHMDQLLSRPEWTDESLSQHYSVSRHLDRSLLQDPPAGGPLPNPHSSHVHF